MRKRNGVILAVIGYIVFFFCIEGWGADWRLYNEGAYYDAESMIHQKDGSVKVWTKWVTPGEKRSFDEAHKLWSMIYEAQGKEEAEWFLTANVVKEMLSLREINCPNRTFRNLASGERDRDGRTVSGHFQNMRVDTETIHHIEPNSDMDRFYKIICK